MEIVSPVKKAINCFRKPEKKTNSKDFGRIEKAVKRAVKEYGETLKKLSRDD